MKNKVNKNKKLVKNINIKNVFIDESEGNSINKINE